MVRLSEIPSMLCKDNSVDDIILRLDLTMQAKVCIQYKKKRESIIV